LDELCCASGATDVLEADERVWKIRRNCLEATRVLSLVSTSDDLVVPVDQIATTIEYLTTVAQNYPFRVFTLAHAGDGNLHFQILKGELSDEEWETQVNKFHAEAYAYIYSLGGKLSGEHGIGAKKLVPMEKYTETTELKMMRAIKRALDPQNVLNPGKVFNA
ncbi:MAG: FAD-linked oxidase C-terminal domain-containing protein, partial [Acidaminococcaceae bacterium]